MRTSRWIASVPYLCLTCVLRKVDPVSFAVPADPQHFAIFGLVSLEYLFVYARDGKLLAVQTEY